MILRFFASEGTTITRNVYLYATGLMLVMLCFAVQYTWVYYWSDKIGMTSRIIMTGAIYRKVRAIKISTVKVIYITYISLITPPRKKVHNTSLDK